MDSLGLDTGNVFQAFFTIFLTLAAVYLQNKTLKRLQGHFLKTENQWDEAIVEAASKPLGLTIWVVGIAFACEIIQKSTNAVIFKAVGPIRAILVIVALTWFLIRLIHAGEKIVLDKEKKTDKTTLDAIGKLLRVSVVITAVLVTLQTLGYSVSGVLAFGGMGGIVVGFAAKDLLANFFGGLMIYLDRPFTVGDWIRSPDREIEGTVEAIGWRLTRIRTFDKRPLYVPNSVFANIAVENPERMQNRRIFETIGLRYNDASKLEIIIENVRSMLKEHPEIDTSKTLIVNFNAFSPSSLDFFIYTFTKTTNWIYFHEVKQGILLRVVKIVGEAGAELAFPTSTVHLAQNNKFEN